MRACEEEVCAEAVVGLDFWWEGHFLFCFVLFIDFVLPFVLLKGG